MTAEVNVGATITTRHFGGYERVDVIEIHDHYYVVSRFSGQGIDLMPKNRIEKVLRQGPESGTRH